MFNEEMIVDEGNIVVILDGATVADLNRAVANLERSFRVDNTTYDGEITVDPTMLTPEQREELREWHGVDAVFSDGSGESGDLEIVLTTGITLTDDAVLIAENFFFLTRDNSDEDDEFAHAPFLPNDDQLKSLLRPLGTNHLAG